MFSTMSMYALPGHKVKLQPYFMTCGYDSDVEKALQYLAIGVTYTVKQTWVGSSHSTVELEEVPGVSFNTIHFKSIIEQSPADDQKHPTYIRYFGGHVG